MTLQKRCSGMQPCPDVTLRLIAADQAAAHGFHAEAARLRLAAQRHRWVCAECQRLQDQG